MNAAVSRGRRIATDIARGLAFLHSQQIVHVSTPAFPSIATSCAVTCVWRGSTALDA